jgi:hypothetical protein
MKKYFFIFAVLCLFTVSNFAQTIEQRYSKYGEVIIKELKNAPFPHEKRKIGRTYNNVLYPGDKHYKDSSVLIFIPKGYKNTGKTDFVIHFHGWRNNIDSVCAQFTMIEQFIASGKNAILLIPEGPKNSPDSFGGKLEDDKGFKRFIDEVMDLLYSSKKIKKKEIGNIILSGHSGGGRVMSFIVMRGGLIGNVKELYIFDGLYEQTEKYAYWLDHYKGKIINIYTEDGGTKGETELLMDDLKGWGIPFIAKMDTVCTHEDLKNNKLIFLYTKLGHNETLSKEGNFTKYLKASILSDLKK